MGIELGLAGKVVAGALAGILGAIFIKYALKRGEQARRKATDLENWVKGSAEAKEAEKRVKKAIENVKKTKHNPLNW